MLCVAVLGQGFRLAFFAIFPSSPLLPMKSMFLLVLFLGLPFAKGLAFRHSAALRVDEVSRARCMAIPESCADGIDEMIETDAIIKEEVRDKRTS